MTHNTEMIKRTLKDAGVAPGDNNFSVLIYLRSGTKCHIRLLQHVEGQYLYGHTFNVPSNTVGIREGDIAMLQILFDDMNDPNRESLL